MSRTPVKVLLASRNTKKLTELQALLAQHQLDSMELLTLNDVAPYEELPEDGATFEDNALIKSREGVVYTGLPTISDDSGLCVDALNGMPGLLSARWSGVHGDDDANNALLLAQLTDVPDQRRGAHYISVCALSIPEEYVASTELEPDTVVEGRWFGTVARQLQGDDGFGYDPLFIPRDDNSEGLSAAQWEPEQKNNASHRRKALDKLIPVLRQLASVK